MHIPMKIDPFPPYLHPRVVPKSELCVFLVRSVGILDIMDHSFISSLPIEMSRVFYPSSV